MKPLAKPIVGILTSQTALLDQVLAALGPHFGRPDYIGAWRVFDHSDYYREEMGEGLMRCFCSFERLTAPHAAAGMKAACVEIENKFSDQGRRSVNIDPGYLDANKLVLISGKYGGNKLQVADNVYADTLLWYNKGWQPLPWAFPDLRDGGYFKDFDAMKRLFKVQQALG